MIVIFPDTHKIIAKNIYNEIYDNYNIKLSKNRLMWGAVSPDILPKYKIYKHYKDDNENMVINEIISLIYIVKVFDFYNLSGFRKTILSNRLGVISHFLCDYVTLPHKEKWTFNDSFNKHVVYEKELNELAKNHKFNSDIISIEKINIYEDETIMLKSIVKKYIDDVVKEYSKAQSYERDLDFGLSLSLNVSLFIIETAIELNKNTSTEYSFVF